MATGAGETVLDRNYTDSLQPWHPTGAKARAGI
jgi:hypothetical protein